MTYTKPPAVVFCLDTEAAAEQWNLGYDAAMQQRIGGTEMREWLYSKIQPELDELVAEADRKGAGSMWPVKRLSLAREAMTRIADSVLFDINMAEEAVLLEEGDQA